ATVEVEALAEVAARHRGALDVPPGAAGAPGRRPRRLTRLRPLPQREVQGRPLAAASLIRDVEPRARLELVERLPRELPIAGEARHVEVNVAGDRVGDPVRDQLLDE